MSQLWSQEWELGALPRDSLSARPEEWFALAGSAATLRRGAVLQPDVRSPVE
jgi:hypothetical protein